MKIKIMVIIKSNLMILHQKSERWLRTCTYSNSHESSYVILMMLNAPHRLLFSVWPFRHQSMLTRITASRNKNFDIPAAASFIHLIIIIIVIIVFRQFLSSQKQVRGKVMSKSWVILIPVEAYLFPFFIQRFRCRISFLLSVRVEIKFTMKLICLHFHKWSVYE